MTITIDSLAQEEKAKRYFLMRNAPLEVMVNGIHSNGHAALAAYDGLLIALSGGHVATEEEPYGIEDMSEFAPYHSMATAPVQPFIATMYQCMRVLNDSMHIVDVLAVRTGRNPPFAIEPEDVSVATYLATLQTAIATLTATVATTQQIATQLGLE